MLFSVMFHHFHDNVRYPESQGSITADDLKKIISYLRANYKLLDAKTYMEKAINHQLDPSDVCLSFDDALQSQFQIAYPILEKEDIKAFFFVYSGAFSNTPPMLEFIRDFRHSFNSIDVYYQAFFHHLETHMPAMYQSYLDTYPEDYLSDFLFYTEPDRRYRYVRDHLLKENYTEILSDLMKVHGYQLEAHRNSLFMSERNLIELNHNGHEIGLHSSNHPTMLHKLSYDQQYAEYKNNYSFLSECIGERITSMSHPCGNYNTDTLSVLKKLGVKLGFRSSLSTTHIASPLEIPREDHSNLFRKIQGQPA